MRIAFGSGDKQWTNHRCAHLKAICCCLPVPNFFTVHTLDRLCRRRLTPLHHSTRPCSPSPLVERLQPEIAKFGQVLRWINRMEPLCIFMPIDRVSEEPFKSLLVQAPSNSCPAGTFSQPINMAWRSHAKATVFTSLLPPTPLLSQLLKWWGFSDEFRNSMVFPLVSSICAIDCKLLMCVSCLNARRK